MTDVETSDPPPEVEADAPVRLSDFVLFFFGRRESILRMVDSRGGLWLAAALVLSAAFAREYDAESLVHEPWHLLGPFGASIVLATVLFLITQLCRRTAKQTIDDAVDDFRAFLTGYWMTAPLAWLYALPIESMTDEVTAVRYNLSALSAVSLWRVFLFTRVIAVRFRLPYWVALVWIGLPCSLIGFVASIQASLAIVPIMGGLQLTEVQAAVHRFQSAIFVILFYTIPVLFVAWIISFVWLRKRATELEQAPANRYRLSPILWGIPVAALLLFVCAAWRFQPPLHRAAVVDRLLKEGELDEAVARLMQHQRTDYPPIWDPPPRSALGESQTPSLEKLIDTLIAAEAPTWINELLLHQSTNIMLRQSEIARDVRGIERIGRTLDAYSDETWEQLERTIGKLRQLNVGKERDREAHLQLLDYVQEWKTRKELISDQSTERTP